jgi:hypothetical protein
MTRLTRERLAQILEQEGVRGDAYSLEGGHPAETYVLDLLPEGWVFFYSERGLESGRRVFDDEDSACRHMLEVLLRDSGAQTRRHDTDWRDRFGRRGREGPSGGGVGSG